MLSNFTVVCSECESGNVSLSAYATSYDGDIDLHIECNNCSNEEVIEQ